MGETVKKLAARTTQITARDTASNHGRKSAVQPSRKKRCEREQETETAVKVVDTKGS